MNTTKILIGGVIGGIVYFLLGWLVYGMLLASTFEPHGALAAAIKDPMIFWMMGVACLFWGLLLAYVLDRSGSNNVSAGAGTATVVAVLTALSFNFGWMSMYDVMTMQQALIDVVVFGVLSAITGAAIGLYYGRK